MRIGFPRRIKDHNVKRFIENKIYLGQFEGTDYKGKRYVVEDYCEPIIDTDLFKRANDVISKRKHKNHLFYIYHYRIYCSCGNVMVQELASGKSGKIYKYYLCKKCKRRVQENRITEEIGDLLEQRSISINTNDIRFKHNRKIRTLSLVKKKIRKSIEDVGNDYPIKTQILDEIEIAINELKDRQPPADKKINYFSLSDEDKQEVFREYYERINVYFTNDIKTTIIIPIKKRKQ